MLVKAKLKERQLSNYTSKKTSPYPKQPIKQTKISDNKRSVVVNNTSQEFLSPK